MFVIHQKSMSSSIESFRTTFIGRYTIQNHALRSNNELFNNALNAICIPTSVRGIIATETKKHHEIGRKVPNNRRYHAYDYSGLIDAACIDAGYTKYSTIINGIEQYKQRINLYEKNLNIKFNENKQLLEQTNQLSNRLNIELKQSSKLNLENKESKYNINQLSIQNNNLNKQINILHGQLNRKQILLDQLSQRTLNGLISKRESESKILTLQNEYSSKIKQNEKLIGNLKGKIKIIEINNNNKINNYNNYIKNLKQKNIKLTSNVTALRSQLSDLKVQIDNWQTIALGVKPSTTSNNSNNGNICNTSKRNVNSNNNINNIGKFSNYDSLNNHILL